MPSKYWRPCGVKQENQKMKVGMAVAVATWLDILCYTDLSTEIQTGALTSVIEASNGTGDHWSATPEFLLTPTITLGLSQFNLTEPTVYLKLDSANVLPIWTIWCLVLVKTKSSLITRDIYEHLSSRELDL